MNDRMKMAAAFAAAMLVQLCAAEYDDYVKLTTSESPSTTASMAFNTSVHWQEPDGSTPTAPMPGKKYYVPSGKQMVTPYLAEHLVFGGDELAIAGTLVPFAKTGYGVTVTNLVFLPYGTYYFVAPNERYLRGTAYIQGTSSQPSRIHYGSSAGIMEYGVNLHGSSDAWLQIYGENGTMSDRRGFQFTGTNENYLGTVEVANNAYLAMGPWPMPAKVIVRSGGTLLGTARNNLAEPSRFVLREVDVEEGARIMLQQAKEAYGSLDSGDRGMLVATVGDLSLASGSRLDFGGGASTNGYLAVTNSLSVAGPVIVKSPVSFSQACSASLVRRHPLIKLAPEATGTLDLGNFAISNDPSQVYYSLPRSELVLEDDSHTLALDVTPVISMTYFASYFSKSNEFIDAYCVVGNITNYWWSDHEAPSPDKDYYIQNPSNDSAKYMPPGYMTFAGRSLLAYGISLTTYNLASTGCRFDDLSMIGGGTMIAGGSSVGFDIDGKITFLSNVAPTTFRSYGSRLLRIGAELAGTGTVHVTTYAPTARVSDMNSITEFKGINTNFTGKLYVTCPNANATGTAQPGSVPCEDYKVTLRISDGRNLGGAMPEFTYDAVKIDQMSVLKVLATTAFDAQNRGIFVQGMARFDIDSGATFTMSNTLTIAGLLRKEGEGTLALGGDLRFIDGAAATAPLATTNVLAVKAGAIKPLATNVLDGAALVFSEGGKLAFDVAPDALGMKEFGFVDRRWATPVARADGFTGKIPVVFDVTRSPAGPPLSSWELGLVTVADAASAESIAEMLKPVNPYAGNGFRTKIGVHENADGSATVCAVFSTSGACLIIR